MTIIALVSLYISFILDNIREIVAPFVKLGAVEYVRWPDDALKPSLIADRDTKIFNPYAAVEGCAGTKNKFLKYSVSNVNIVI